MEQIDPCNISEINERIHGWAETPGSLRPITIQHVVVADDALDALASLTRSLSAGGPTMLVIDETPMSRGPDDLKTTIQSVLGPAVPLTLLRLPNGPDGFFHADLAVAEPLSRELSAYAAVVSVGSGSVTDVVKYARHLLAERSGRSVPFICFPTAASVTAFTSALAVLTMDGVKRTLASRGPDAVVCDLRTLADAPLIMTVAGFGDVVARSVAYGDWFLASQLGMDDSFSHAPSRLLEAAEKTMLDAAEQVAARELGGVRAVTDAVLLAGMAMSIVNQTAPISGWEHVISHFLDMTAAHDRRRMALHGGQVGVATLVAARAYERGWQHLDLDRIQTPITDHEITEEHRRVNRVFARYDTSGKMAAEIWRELNKKLFRWKERRPDRVTFVDRKNAGEYEAFLKSAVRSSDDIEAFLRRAAAPRRFADLNETVPSETARAAVRFSHLIRARFTLGDLLEVGGWLSDETATGVLNEAG